MVCRILGLGLEVARGGTAIVDNDHCEVGGKGVEGCLPAMGRGDLRMVMRMWEMKTSRVGTRITH